MANIPTYPPNAGIYGAPAEFVAPFRDIAPTIEQLDFGAQDMRKHAQSLLGYVGGIHVVKP